MFDRRTDSPRVQGCLILIGVLLGTTRNAEACGATPTELQELLPASGASDVPRNAALITSSNLTSAGMELREVSADTAAAAEGAADAGTDGGTPGAVALDIECDDAPYGGAVCLGRPRVPLKANTRYEWRGLLSGGDGPPSRDLASGEWRSFTTGSYHDDEPADPRNVTIRVVRNERLENPLSAPCGISHWVELDYELSGPEPAVINHAGYTPQYVMHATLLRPEAVATRVTLYMPPECLEPMVYDRAGSRTALPRICLDPATEIVEPAPAPTDNRLESRWSCTLTKTLRAPAHVRWPALMGLALAFALVLRRRSGSRRQARGQ